MKIFQTFTTFLVLFNKESFDFIIKTFASRSCELKGIRQLKMFLRNKMNVLVFLSCFESSSLSELWPLELHIPGYFSSPQYPDIGDC